MHPFLDFICDQLVSQRLNDIFIHQTFPNSALLTEETLTLIINECNIFKKI